MSESKLTCQDKDNQGPVVESSDSPLVAAAPAPLKTPLRRLEWNRAWRIRNKDKVSQNKRQYYYANRDAIHRYKKKYYDTHREQFRQYSHNAYQERKVKVLKMLGEPKCVNCGCMDPRLLEVNHVNGGGRAERKGKNNNIYERITCGKRDTKDLNTMCRVCNQLDHIVRKYPDLAGKYKITYVA